MGTRELDALVAEKVLQYAVYRSFGPEGITTPWLSLPGWVGTLCPHYSANHADVRLMEDAIERRGLGEAYVEHLGSLCAPDAYEESPRYQWALLRATPEQRCRAALAACGVEL